MIEWTEEELKLLLEHYDYYSSRGKTWMLSEDWLPNYTKKQIIAKVRKMKKTGEWEMLYRQFNL